MYFVFCPKQGLEIEDVVLHRGKAFRVFFMLNRVSISNPRRHPYTQT